MSVSLALAHEIEAYQALLRDTRAHERRCGALIERALSVPLPHPDHDSDTFDADEDSTLPPAPSHDTEKHHGY